MSEISATEFEKQYATRSGVSVDFLHENGRAVEPCDCGHADCQGWQMGYSREDAAAYAASVLRGYTND